MTGAGSATRRAAGVVAVLLLVGGTGYAAGHMPAPPMTDIAWPVATAGAPAEVTGQADPDSAVVGGDVETVQNQVATPVPRAAEPWVAAMSTVTGIGAVALRAYADATLHLAASDPGCAVGWTTLAAIGAVESGHGTHGGTQLGADGRPGIPIIGPPLDGTPGTAAIRAGVDDREWHGDPTWAHAVGPMQFLPSTWRRWASDGDGDGQSDPNDIDDAALAAGRYLCASGSLADGDGWRTAILSYNHSDAYVALVLETANHYADASRSAAG
ncbi:lytic transglycosylase domain-containing protein [Cellulomonas sp.]|uniref:lytic transglycosylase domain-containing protein n=1 Tax=Cellulomonas sp. TaxID=40001 RepID=UPI003BA9E899